MGTAAIQAAQFIMRKNSRSRRFAQALPKHTSGMTIASAGLYVQDDLGHGLPWVSLGAGTTGSGILEGGESVINDGGVSWARYNGRLLVPPATP
jgi:hypothetical protein